MVFNHTYRIGLEDCGKENEATNKAILTILEDIAGLHSATVGLGLNEINKTGCAWVILKWQVQIIKRPEYNDELNVFTWSTTANKLFADRDFKVLDSNGQTVIIATSRWIYMDINKRRPVRITAEIMDRYESEPERRVKLWIGMNLSQKDVCFQKKLLKMRFPIQNIKRFRIIF